MPKLRVRDCWRRLRVGLAVLTVVAVVALTVWPAAALDCEGDALDDGCLFTITGGDTTDPDDGYAVTNADSVPLWDFVRERDLQAIGYPISQRWVNGRFTFQAFQKVILQWDPGKRRMNYYNTLDVLANRYPEVELPNVPPHLVLEADQDAVFATIKRSHLLLLDQNPIIKERFLSEPDWLNLYGLPIRYEEREVNGNPQGLQMLRAQRTVFVIWNVPAPGTTLGRVNLQNVPDKVKKLSNVIIPDAAEAPVRRDAVAGLPRFTLPPPTPPPRPPPRPPAPPPPASDRDALIQLYHATDGPNWTNNTNWLSETPLDEWHGVTADGHAQIIELRLHDNRLRGTIPPALGYLGKLRRLELNDNQLHGAIPPTLGYSADLRSLGLADNRLQGPIPPELSRLANLQWLSLANNRLAGAIPPELGRLANLEWLSVWGNRLSGTIPPELGDLSNLRHLRLFGNQLSGEIPPALRRLANLEQLLLSDNQLSGAIPHELASLANLRVLELNSNQLRGEIPPALGRLANLQRLVLSANQLSGAIPPELGDLSNLVDLRLYWNQLHGEIPPALSRLANLKRLLLAHNQLRGTIPPALGRLANLTELGLDDNQLRGEIPPELGSLANLTALHLAENQLTGEIPPALAASPI